MSIKQTEVSPKLADMIWELERQLREEFRLDFSYTIMAKGNMVGASNNRDGFVTPKVRK